MSEKKELPKLYKRHWLNEEEQQGSGYVIVSAGLEESYPKQEGDYYLEAEIEIKDCSRQITLDFNCWEVKDYPIKLAKLDGLMERLNELKAFMVANPPTKVKKKKDRKLKLRDVVAQTTSLEDSGILEDKDS